MSEDNRRLVEIQRTIAPEKQASSWQKKYIDQQEHHYRNQKIRCKIIRFCTQVIVKPWEKWKNRAWINRDVDMAEVDKNELT